MKPASNKSKRVNSVVRITMKNGYIYAKTVIICLKEKNFFVFNGFGLIVVVVAVGGGDVGGGDVGGGDVGGGDVGGGDVGGGDVGGGDVGGGNVGGGDVGGGNVGGL